MVDYYAKVAPAIVPHLSGRAVTLRRFPEGVDDLDSAFFEKRCPKHRPKWVKTARVQAGPNAGKIDFCVCDSLPTLIWMAQLAAIELHPSLSLRPGAETADRPRLRPRPRAAGRRRRLLAGGAAPARGARPARARVLRQDLGLEGDAALRPAQHQNHLRGDPPLRPGAGPADRQADPRRGAGENGQKDRPQRQGPDRLVPEQRTQNDDLRLLAASPRAPHLLDPGHLGGGRSGGRARATARSLVFEAGDVLERIEEHGDLFAPVLELEQELPQL